MSSYGKIVYPYGQLENRIQIKDKKGITLIQNSLWRLSHPLELVKNNSNDIIQSSHLDPNENF